MVTGLGMVAVLGIVAMLRMMTRFGTMAPGTVHRVSGQIPGVAVVLRLLAMVLFRVLLRLAARLVMHVVAILVLLCVLVIVVFDILAHCRTNLVDCARTVFICPFRE